MLLFDEQYITYITDILCYARNEVLISTFKAEIPRGNQAPHLAKFIDLLQHTARKHIPVYILLNWNSEKARVPRTNLRFQREMLASSAKIRHLKQSRCVHTKLFLCDSSVMVIGSHNLSTNATSRNFELSTVVTDQAAIKQVRDHFFRLFDDGVDF
jgi:phosphatidylserine/phosphatidylglycerophosphate/cardiolipin synthase-like enzyme